MESFGPYELLERVAVGGMAEIFLARRKGPGGFNKRIVIKRVLPELARQAEFRRMFADEARLCASLNHQTLVMVFEYGEIDDTPYLAMEWVDGCDLGRLLEQGPLSPAGAAHLVAEVMRALSVVHQACDEEGEPLNVVHRDLAPGNILLSRSGEVKLGDFGVAKATGRLARTSAGQLKGTLAYLSPEQARGDVVDARTDLYAGGLVLFELLTGERFLRAQGEVELIREAASPPDRLGELGGDVPRKLRKVLASALAPQPSERFASAAAMERALRACCPDSSAAQHELQRRVDQCASLGESVRDRRRRTEIADAARETSWDRLRRRVERLLHHWSAKVAGVAIVAVLIAGSVPLWWSSSPESVPSEGSLPESNDGAAASGVAQVQPSVDGDVERPAMEADLPSGDVDAGDAALSSRVEAGPRRERDSARADAGREALTPATPSAVERPLRPEPARATPRPAIVDAGLAAAAPDSGASAAIDEPMPDVEASWSAATSRAAGRGIMVGDDAELDRRRRRVVELARSGESSGERFEAISAYRARLSEIVVDREFVDRKMQRVSRLVRDRGVEGERAEELAALSQRALRSAMGGDYEGANRVLNRMLARLR